MPDKLLKSQLKKKQATVNPSVIKNINMILVFNKERSYTFTGWKSWLIASCALESADEQASVPATAPCCDRPLVLLDDGATRLRGLRGCP